MLAMGQGASSVERVDWKKKGACTCVMGEEERQWLKDCTGIIHTFFYLENAAVSLMVKLAKLPKCLADVIRLASCGQ